MNTIYFFLLTLIREGKPGRIEFGEEMILIEGNEEAVEWSGVGKKKGRIKRPLASYSG